MSRAQRLTFLGIAVIIAVVAGILLADGGGETEKAANPAPSATPSGTATATATATPTPKPKPKAPLLQAGNERTLSFDEGDTVRFRVRHDDKQELAPNRTETVSFKASITGIFEIELEHSGTLLAHLKVEP
jgi:hypothetical protein